MSDADVRLMPGSDAQAWVASLTRLDKHRVIESLNEHELRAFARHALEYAPQALDRALAERLIARRDGERDRFGQSRRAS